MLSSVDRDLHVQVFPMLHPHHERKVSMSVQMTLIITKVV
jgi:hypothetical protein